MGAGSWRASSPHDSIGTADKSVGSAVLRIAYSDQSLGVLTVSCDLVGIPSCVFEGIRTMKGSVDYWNREAPASPGNAGRTTSTIASED